MKGVKAVVMAGGQGTRLRPLTIGRPKPMVPVVNQPILAHILDLLKRNGITEVVITLQFLPDIIRDYFGNGEELDMVIHYCTETLPLGTAGSVKNAQKYLDDTFIVISGDALTDFNLPEIIDAHNRNGALATVTLYRVPDPLEYGVTITDAEGRITQFLEKPSWGEVMSDTVNTGMYVLEPEVLDYCEEDKSCDFSQDLFPLLLKKEAPLFGHVSSGYWCDIGDISEYMRASFDLLEGKVNHGEVGKHTRDGIWCGGDVEIAPDAQLYGPIYLGDGVQIKENVVIHGPAVIKNQTIVDNRAHIDRSIIWRNSYIGEAAEVRGATICRQVSLMSRAVVFEGAVIGDVTLVGEGAVLHSGVKVWPEKEVEAGAIVKSSIIWGAMGRRVLFGRFGITGLINVDLTPEVAARIGAAFGSTLPLGASVTMNRDVHRSPRMIKRAIISGLPSAGIHVADLRNVPIPVARYITRISDAAGGVHVRLSPFDNRVVDIKFFDELGMDLSKATERKIERNFFREEFRRVYLGDVGTIAYAPEVVERYVRGFMDSINVEEIQRPSFHIVVDYAHAPSSLVLPPILNVLNCDVVALNARIDESKMSILPEEFDHALEQLAVISGALQVDLGARLDVGGEKLFLVDDRGEILPGVTASAAIAALALRANPGGTIVVPVHAPSIFERIAAEYGGQVNRCKADIHSLMVAASEEEVVMAGDSIGHHIFPDFHPAIDAQIAIAKLLEFLATQDVKLSSIVASLPEFHQAKRRIPCGWEDKGTVMRHFSEHYRTQGEEQIDGFKISLGEEWVLVLPDPDKPFIFIYAESDTGNQAEELADKYARIVEGFQS
jgi:mannose-1-phosphate guanylyltransferase/phosphomannomutase